MNDTPEVNALRQLAQEPTGIDRALLDALIAYEKSRDKKIKIALLQQADKNASADLMVRVLDPDQPNPQVPHAVIENLQNLRNTLIMARVFRDDDGYLDILSRTNWIAPPEGSVNRQYSKAIVEAVAMSHAYDLTTNPQLANDYYGAVSRILTTNTPDTQSAEMMRIVRGEGSTGRMPRLVRVYIEVFAHAQMTKMPTEDRKPSALLALRAAHDAISAYRFQHAAQARKHFEDGYRIAFGKSSPNQKVSREAQAIAVDIQAGFGRSATTATPSSSDVARLKAEQKAASKAFTTEIDALAKSTRNTPSSLSLRQRAAAIREAAVRHNPQANIPPVPPVNTAQDLQDYAKQIKSAVSVAAPITRADQTRTTSESIARGIGIITALDSPHSRTSTHSMLGDAEAQPRNIDDKSVERIRNLQPNLGIK